MWMKWDPIEYYFYCTLILSLIGLKVAVYSRTHVAKYNLIVIIASCLDVCCVLTVRNILYKSDNTQQDGLSLSLSLSLFLSLKKNENYVTNYGNLDMVIKDISEIAEAGLDGVDLMTSLKF